MFICYLLFLFFRFVVYVEFFTFFLLVCFWFQIFRRVDEGHQKQKEELSQELIEVKVNCSLWHWGLGHFNQYIFCVCPHTGSSGLQ